MSEIELWQFTRSHPDCGHCKTMLQALTKWGKETHYSCPCICHTPHRAWYENNGRKRPGRAAKKT